MPPSRVAALILAAGASSRMGQPKQLLDWDGRPLVRAAADVALAAKLDPLVVVVGYAQAQVEQALAGLPLRLVANPDYAAGQSTSLRAGIEALGQAAAAFRHRRAARRDPDADPLVLAMGRHCRAAGHLGRFGRLDLRRRPALRRFRP